MPKAGMFVNGGDLFEDDDITEVEQIYSGLDKIMCPHCGLCFITDTHSEDIECELCGRLIDS